MPLAAIVLAGGRARRLGGLDKAAIEVGGRTLLDTVLTAVAGCDPVVVVGPRTLGGAGYARVQEDPPHGGPAAGLLTGLATLSADAELVVALAVDLPGVTTATVARLLAGLTPDLDGAALVDAEGRRQPALVLRTAALRRAAPGRAEWSGLSLRWLLEPLTLAAVAATPAEAQDVDTPSDLRRLGGP